MKQYIDKTAVVAEIERRMQELRPTNTHKMQVGEKMDGDVLMWLNALTWVKKVIDTLEVKEIYKQSPTKDLKTAAGNYAFTQSEEDEVLKYYAFIAGAQWQKEQMIDKAFKYINYQLNLPNDFEQHFRKAMEK